MKFNEKVVREEIAPQLNEILARINDELADEPMFLVMTALARLLAYGLAEIDDDVDRKEIRNGMIKYMDTTIEQMRRKKPCN